MEFIKEKKDFNISKEVYTKIIRDFKSELKSNKNSFKIMRQLDYDYGKMLINIDDFINLIEFFENIDYPRISGNVIVCYNGNPKITIQLLLMSLKNSNITNLVINEFCLGINRLIFEIFNSVLKEYRIFKLVSFNNFENKNDIKNAIDYIDKIYFFGVQNLYTICKDFSKDKIKFIPFTSVYVFCEDEKYSELKDNIFDFCIENNIDIETFEDENIEEVISIINQSKDKYCSLILTQNKEYINIFKENIKFGKVYANESFLKDDIFYLNIS